MEPVFNKKKYTIFNLYHEGLNLTSIFLKYKVVSKVIELQNLYAFSLKIILHILFYFTVIQIGTLFFSETFCTFYNDNY